MFFMQSTRTLHIAPGFDKSYLVPFYALVASLFDSNQRNNLVFHVIGTGLPMDERTGIQQYITSKGGVVHLYEIAENFADDFPDHSWFGSATFYRLLFPALLPSDIERFLYIDTDTIVTMDLLELFNLDMGTAPVAAVSDAIFHTRPEVGVYTNGGYFNAGVLLIDRRKWLELNLSEKAVDFLKKNHKVASFLDQDALNAILVNNWYHLESKYNLVPDYIPRTLKSNEAVSFSKDKIVHYAQFYKPWHYLCNNRLRFLYAKYLAMTPKAIVPFGTSKKTWNGMKQLLKLRVRELYYDYPIIPLGLMDRLRGVAK